MWGSVRNILRDYVCCQSFFKKKKTDERRKEKNVFFISLEALPSFTPSPGCHDTNNYKTKKQCGGARRCIVHRASSSNDSPLQEKRLSF